MTAAAAAAAAAAAVSEYNSFCDDSIVIVDVFLCTLIRRCNSPVTGGNGYERRRRILRISVRGDCITNVTTMSTATAAVTTDKRTSSAAAIALLATQDVHRVIDVVCM